MVKQKKIFFSLIFPDWGLCEHMQTVLSWHPSNFPVCRVSKWLNDYTIQRTKCHWRKKCHSALEREARGANVTARLGLGGYSSPNSPNMSPSCSLSIKIFHECSPRHVSTVQGEPRFSPTVSWDRLQSFQKHPISLHYKQHTRVWVWLALQRLFSLVKKQLKFQLHVALLSRL